jgi:hypothetical protein
MKKLTCLWIIVFFLSLQMMAQVKKATIKPSVALPPDLEEALKDLPADQRDAVKDTIDKQMSCSCKNHYAFR